jgi:hypothetical protein
VAAADENKHIASFRHCTGTFNSFVYMQRGCKGIMVTSVTVQHDRNLQLYAELHFSLTGRGAGVKFTYYFIGSRLSQILRSSGLK